MCSVNNELICYLVTLSSVDHMIFLHFVLTDIDVFMVMTVKDLPR